MTDQYDRTRRLIGEAGLARLRAAHVVVAGVGGVGSFAAEALARAGIGRLTLIDHDTVDITNLNRQIHATRETVGAPKVEVMAARIASIDPSIAVRALRTFVLPENVDAILAGESCEYVIDAVDTVTAKVALILCARAHGIPLISSMGAANKLDAGKFEITDLSRTHTCPLARALRQQLRRRGVETGVEVLYSTARPYPPAADAAPEEDASRRQPPGSISYVPAVAGLLLAGHVIQRLLERPDAETEGV